MYEGSSRDIFAHKQHYIERGIMAAAVDDEK